MAPNLISPSRRAKRPPADADSEDELCPDEAVWEWIYESSASATPTGPTNNDDKDPQSNRKRRKVTSGKIVGARIGQFECHIGDTVLLKADGSNDAWVALVGEFVDDEEDGEMAANFMWFSTEKEIRNREKKRSDFLWVNTNDSVQLTTPG